MVIAFDFTGVVFFTIVVDVVLVTGLSCEGVAKAVFMQRAATTQAAQTDVFISLRMVLVNKPTVWQAFRLKVGHSDEVPIKNNLKTP
ncbi:hypothetical protein GCM10028809_32070 [Spirosoma gilvum]